MPKKLGDFLKDLQEPFALDNYLLERGFSNKNSKNSNRSAIYSLHKKRKFIPNCPKIVTTLLNRFVPVFNENKIKNSDQDNCDRDIEKSKQEIADDDKSLSSFSTSNNTEKRDIEELATKRKNVEETHQLSPVSVLEETQSSDVSPVQKTKMYLKRIEEASSLSICVWNLEKPLNSNSGEMQQFEVRDTSRSFAHYNKNKKVMLQTKQLLLDCVKEILDNQRRKHGQKILGAEELRKLIYENIWLWSQEAINESNIEQILFSSIEEWSNLDVQTSEIGNEIGDAILEDISNLIILDMINFVVS